MDQSILTVEDEGMRILVHLLISAGIGLLIGLEREFSKQVREKEQAFAGIRTFTLVAIFGYLSVFLAAQTSEWLLVAAFLSMVVFVVISYLRLTKLPGHFGGTSEITLIITFLLPVLVHLDYVLVAVIIMVMVLLLLTYKPSLHKFARTVTEQEIRAFVQFVIISALVIPFLPDKDFGPYDAWNLKDIWKMVILVSGISLAGYLLSKLFGDKGTIIAGIVGGLASSTAVALSFSRRSKEESASAHIYAIGIIAASTIMFPRVFFEILAVNSALVKYIWIQIAVITIIGLAVAYLIHRTNKSKDKSGKIELDNPLNFSTAIKFAFIYAAILLLVKFASNQFGETGIYVASIISGISDVDAITISMAKMARNGNPQLAVNAILLATLSNTIVKFIIVISIGSISLRKFASIGYGSVLGAGLAMFCLQLLFIKQK